MQINFQSEYLRGNYPLSDFGVNGIYIKTYFYQIEGGVRRKKEINVQIPGSHFVKLCF
jgi:hypothetical protein